MLLHAYVGCKKACRTRTTCPSILSPTTTAPPQSSLRATREGSVWAPVAVSLALPRLFSVIWEPGEADARVCCDGGIGGANLMGADLYQNLQNYYIAHLATLKGVRFIFALFST